MRPAGKQRPTKTEKLWTHQEGDGSCTSHEASGPPERHMPRACVGVDVYFLPHVRHSTPYFHSGFRFGAQHCTTLRKTTAKACTQH